MSKKGVNAGDVNDKNQPRKGLPEQLLWQLNEHTNNSFCLFYLDENGCLQSYAQFDNRAYANTLIRDIKIFCSVLDDANENATIQALIGNPEDESGENAENPSE